VFGIGLILCAIMLPPYRVWLFLISTFGLLGLMSLAMTYIGNNPSEGLCFRVFQKQVCLTYFSIQDIVGFDKFKQDALRSQLLAKEKQERINEENRLLESINSLSDSIHVASVLADKDSTRFWLPNDDRQFWHVIFNAWDKLKSQQKSFRILHYGDSQIEMDRITSYVRERLQLKFGGGGPGLLPPHQLVPSLTMSQTSEGIWNRMVSYGASETRAPHNRYGVAGIVYAFDSLQASSFIKPRYKDKFYPIQQADVAKVILGQLSSSAKVQISYPKGSNTQVVSASSGEKMIRWSFDTTQPYYHFHFYGDTNLNVLGIALDKKWGISMDNIAWRGSSGLTFTSINRSSLQQTYQMLGVKMLILQFGGNSVPYVKEEKGAVKYAEQLGRQIAFLKSIDSTLSILVIGPADMSVNQMGERVTHPMLEEVVEQMRKVCNKEGAAFWSMYHAMGGYKSMDRWVKSSPALGAPDHIHFTTKGAEVMSDLFYRALMREYDIYDKNNRLKTSSQD